MKAVVTKKEIELALHDRFGDVFERHEQALPETLATGVIDIDHALGGFPRGAITEIYGAQSSGRTSVLLATLASATSHQEACALIDCHDTFDLSSAAEAGVDFKRLLWVRCRSRLERAFKAADLILHAGGFGFVVLNLCDVPAKMVRRVISSWWFRFKRAIENTPTVLLVLTPVAAVRSCASLAFVLKNERAGWSRPAPLVFEISSDRFLKISEPRHLSLVRPSNAVTAASPVPAHAHLLQTMQIRVNRERPLNFSPGIMQFKPQFHATGLVKFGDIR